jgi:hypothetical protein
VCGAVCAVCGVQEFHFATLDFGKDLSPTGAANATKSWLTFSQGTQRRGLPCWSSPNTFTNPLPLGFSYASGLSASQPFPGKPANFFIPRDRRSAKTGRRSCSHR